MTKRIPYLTFTIVFIAIFFENSSCVTLRQINEPNGLNGKIFFVQVEDETTTFEEAKLNCKNAGYEMATIQNVQENNVIGKELIERAEGGKRVYYGWLGGSDVGSEGNWYWLPNKTPITGFLNWGDNFYLQNSPDYSCMFMSPTTRKEGVLGTWKPMYCKPSYAATICQNILK